MKDNSVAILGGGPSGICAAWELHRNDIKMSLFESSSSFGGNARTISINGFRFDTGAHRLHVKDPSMLELYREILKDQLHKVDAPSVISFKNSFLTFPLSPVNVTLNLSVKQLFRGGTDFLMRPRAGADSLRDHAYSRYGKFIADTFLLNYSRKLWGVDPSTLIPDTAGKRLNGLSMKTFLTEVLRGKRTTAEHLDGVFFYPGEGIGQLFDLMIASLPAENLSCNAAVTRLAHAKGIIKEVTAGSKTIKPSSVVSTIPVTILLRALDPAPPAIILEAAEKLVFRNLKLVLLCLNRASVSKNASIYFPSASQIFTRVSEPRNRSPLMAPEGKTSLMAEIPFFAQDDVARLGDSEISYQVVQELQRLNLVNEEEILETKVITLHNAYPVLTRSAVDSLSLINDYLLTFKNLYSCGRNGKFEYLHIHNLFQQARQVATMILNNETRR